MAVKKKEVKCEYDTWLDRRTGLRHYVSHVHDHNTWDTVLLCGGYVTARPGEPRTLVTCLRCWSRVLKPPAMADLVVIDEAQSIDREKFEALLSLLPSPPETP